MTPVRRVLTNSLFVLLFHSPLLFGQLLVETFDYPTGQLTDLSSGANVSNGKWLSLSGTGNPILVSEGSLLYNAYPSSGGGNRITIKSISSSAEDAAITFGERTAGMLYVSFLLSVTDTTGLRAVTDSVGDFFAALLPGTSSTTFVGRVSIRRGATKGSFQLGIRTSSQNGKAEWAPVNLPLDSTHLVVFSYCFVTGSKNDTASLWLNPDLRLTRPAPLVTQTGAATSEPNDLNRLIIRQDGTDTPDASIDGIRVGTSWDESPLPVQLATFEGFRIGEHTVRLEWTTQSEVNNYGFCLQRSCYGSEYALITNSFVAGGGTTLLPCRYVFTDSNACPGECSYRLQQTDLDGTLHLSDAISIFPFTSVSATKTLAFRLFPSFPNPFNPKSDIRYQISEIGYVKLAVYDLLGREVATLVNERKEPGMYTVTWNASGMASGVYVYRLRAGSLVQSEKMILTR